MGKKHYLLCSCLFVLCSLQLCGCGGKHQDMQASDTDAVEETTKEEEIRQEIHVGDAEIAGYSNEVVTWGPGIQTGEDNRPVAPVAFHERYKSLGADFIRENEKIIYLTFDEGYENGYTGKILDVLNEKNVSAVFFVTMPYAREQTELMKRMVEEGHVIGNHSVTHPAQGMPSLSLEEQKQELQELHQYVLENYGYRMYLFRPPVGIFSEQSLAVTANMGYRTVLWSFAYADWDPDKQMGEEAALKKMEDRLHNGAIYLLHAVSKTNAAVLSDFIDDARAMGYTFVKYTE